MPRAKTKTLTEAELRLMQILWDQGPSTVSDVAQALEPPRLAYNSVLTTLRVLEQKGYVSHARKGRAFVYEPLLARHDARRQAIRHLVELFFHDSRQLLAQNLIEDGDWNADDLAELRRGLRRASTKGDSNGDPTTDDEASQRTGNIDGL